MGCRVSRLCRLFLLCLFTDSTFVLVLCWQHFPGNSTVLLYAASSMSACIPNCGLSLGQESLSDAVRAVDEGGAILPGGPLV